MLKLFALSLLMAFSVGAQIAQPLLPFQGRLIASDGKPVPDGSRLVQFQIWSEPSGGSLLWAGEQHRVTVNGGLINVVLGSKTPFTAFADSQKSFFDRALYLEIKVAADSKGEITSNDPPLLPRQSIFPVPFASESRVSYDSKHLGGHDWKVIFGTNDPGAGFVLGNRIQANSIPADRIQPIASNQIAQGGVAFTNLEKRRARSPAPLGGVAISNPVTFSTNSWNAGFVEVRGLTVSLVTSGRPVYIALIAGPPPQPLSNPSTPVSEASYIGVENQPDWASTVAGAFAIFRNETNLVSMDRVSTEWYSGNGAIGKAHVPAGSVHALDLDAAEGVVTTYSVKINSGDPRARVVVRNVRLIAYEL